MITGAGSPNGIGQAKAWLFADYGARVALIDFNKTDLANARKEFTSHHNVYDCDILNRVQARAIINQIAKILVRSIF